MGGRKGKFFFLGVGEGRLVGEGKEDVFVSVDLGVYFDFSVCWYERVVKFLGIWVFIYKTRLILVNSFFNCEIVYFFNILNG